MNDSQKDVDLSEGMAPSKIVGLFYLLYGFKALYCFCYLMYRQLNEVIFVGQVSGRSVSLAATRSATSKPSLFSSARTRSLSSASKGKTTTTTTTTDFQC